MHPAEGAGADPVGVVVQFYRHLDDRDVAALIRLADRLDAGRRAQLRQQTIATEEPGCAG